jgi:type IV secretory pathway TraG/TraD family ATPase VirD4
MTSDITPEVLLDGSASTLYLCAPAHEQRRLQPIFAALLAELLNAAAERASLAGKPLDPPLLVVLDECANIAPLSSLDALASSGAGQGIQLVTVFQDVAQITTASWRASLIPRRSNTSRASSATSPATKSPRRAVRAGSARRLNRRAT